MKGFLLSDKDYLMKHCKELKDGPKYLPKKVEYEEQFKKKTKKLKHQNIRGKTIMLDV